MPQPTNQTTNQPTKKSSISWNYGSPNWSAYGGIHEEQFLILQLSPLIV